VKASPEAMPILSGSGHALQIVEKRSVHVKYIYADREE
jgi:hypothetical protein